MFMLIDYMPRGVCANRMNIQVDDGIITAVDIIGGCSGNLQGISRLLAGMPVSDAIAKMQGIRCGPKSTSCPDQIASALQAAAQ